MNKVKKTHGINNLEKKSKRLVLHETNTNEIFDILGAPSTKSDTDPNTWIYIERTLSNSNILKIGKEKIKSNNLLVLKIDSRGILDEIKFYDKKKINNIEFSSELTELDLEKNNFFSNFFNNIRRKINDPIRNRLKKNKSN